MKIKAFTKQDDSPVVDMTPLIDVVFILLIFFILSANFNNDPVMDIDRPNASSSKSIQNVKTLNISIDHNKEIWFNNENVTINQLKNNIKSHLLNKNNINAVVSADRNLDTGTLIKIIDTIRLSGISNVAIATEHN